MLPNQKASLRHFSLYCLSNNKTCIKQAKLKCNQIFVTFQKEKLVNQSFLRRGWSDHEVPVSPLHVPESRFRDVLSVFTRKINSFWAHVPLNDCSVSAQVEHLRIRGFTQSYFSSGESTLIYLFHVQRKFSWGAFLCVIDLSKL